MITGEHIDTLKPAQMRAALLALMGELATQNSVIARQSNEAVFKQALIDKLTHENALLKRMKFAAQSERFSAEQKSLLDETLDEDLQAVADEIAQAMPPIADRQDKQVPKRAPLPANQPPRKPGRFRAPHPGQVGLREVRNAHPSAYWVFRSNVTGYSGLS